jgi:hypothetical protein
MRTPVFVDTPYPTVWETAQKMGVSKKRTKELIKLADEIMVRRGMTRAPAYTAIAVRRKRRQNPT